mmetsp:Transcript_31014/g.71457  ORF Transcript_31014/g.71457 Transcript_31014/m.71457 type:complete len:147 (-) Transcript_31014:374-814(-)
MGWWWFLHQGRNNLRSFVTASTSGAFVTFGSMTVGLVGAVFVERTAHRTLYRFFPHWYMGIEHLYGLADEPTTTAARRWEKPTSTMTTPNKTSPPLYPLSSSSLDKTDVWSTDILTTTTTTPSIVSTERFTKEPFLHQVKACAITA